MTDTDRSLRSLPIPYRGEVKELEKWIQDVYQDFLAVFVLLGHPFEQLFGLWTEIQEIPIKDGRQKFTLLQEVRAEILRYCKDLKGLVERMEEEVRQMWAPVTD